MIWLLLVTAHLIGVVSYTLLLRKSALGNLNKLLMAALMLTGNFLPTLVFLALGKVVLPSSPTDWFFLILGGGMLAGLSITNVWALSRLDVSIFTILYNLRLLMTTLLGFLILQELPSILQIIGGLVILLSIFILNLHKDRQWRSPAVLIGVFSMMWFSFHAVLEKYNLQQVDVESYLFIVCFFGMLFLWILVFIKRINIKSQLIHIHDKKIYALVFTRVLSGYAYVYALKYSSLAVLNYVSGMSVALIVLFGIYILGEKENIRQKIVAVAVACIGLTLILLGRLL